MYDATNDLLPTETTTPAKPRLIRLLLILHQRLIRDAFRALAKEDGRFFPASVPHDGGGAGRDRADSLPPTAPSVALIDSASDERATRDLLASHQVVGGVMLTDLAAGGERGELIVGPVRLGGVALAVHGYDAAWEEVGRALAIASRGGAAAEAQKPLAHRRVDQGRPIADDLERYLSLTPRERDVLIGIGSGLAPPEIASKLHIAVSTAENHKSRLMKKIGIHRTAELVRFAIRVGAAPI